MVDFGRAVQRLLGGDAPPQKDAQPEGSPQLKIVPPNDPLVLQLSDASLPAAWRSEEESRRIEVIERTMKAVPVIIKEGFVARRYDPFSNSAYLEQVPGSQGSGALIDQQRGLILTNSHVVHDAKKVMVEFNGEKTPADVIIDDKRLDIALLRVRKIPNGMQAIPLGDSFNLVAGQSVIAIGSPFGLEHSTTSGVISNPNRMFPENPHSLVPMIQTDAAVNPGNSGGPLIDLDGRLIGINRMVQAGPGGGITFAIPVNEVKKLLRDAVSNGLLAPRFGFTFADSKQGVFVQSVAPGSPAERAHIVGYDQLKESGQDIATEIFFVDKVNGVRVNSAKDVSREIGRSEPNRPVKFEFKIGRQRESYGALLLAEGL